ncbi:hypothetical protein [Psychroserpens ponticola]|uniref:DUF2199 domain-containing protein n=1 Tax=Psychroserpens ponticola TaxID=2932268 RepID=A0ABY7S330_9FLAO|nr:hypothetical protein [Psychroserpens ponticola]WCO03589.1 hypothetical protein MUN68_008780 [Psychroserpens ponticola]
MKIKNEDFIKTIQNQFKEIDFNIIPTLNELELEFESPFCKSFKFQICVESLWTLSQVYAIPNLHPNSYFWYNDIMFNPSSEDVNENWIEESQTEILNTLDILLKHPIRIEQVNGIFTSSFKCEYKIENWIELSKNSLLTLSKKTIPPIDGKKYTYY